jgi:hypothetical protein
MSRRRHHNRGGFTAPITLSNPPVPALPPEVAEASSTQIGMLLRLLLPAVQSGDAGPGTWVALYALGNVLRRREFES